MFSGSIKLYHISEFHSFLWLKNILFHLRGRAESDTTEVTQQHMYIPQFVYPIIMFISYFHILAIGNNATVNIAAQVSESLFSLLLDIYLGMELLSHIVIPFSFLRNRPTVFYRGCIISIPTSKEGVFQFLYTFTSILFFIFVCLFKVLTL